jgi:hypothetical protein
MARSRRQGGSVGNAGGLQVIRFPVLRRTDNRHAGT